MSRTYIGPFGRILPVPENSEPERLQFPIDETRTNMTTYQLPPPDRLQFGSDTTPGFTEPLRYNTISQSRRVIEPTNTMYRERAGQPHRQHLPSLSSLLTPTSHPGLPTSSYPHEASPNTPDWQSTLSADHRSLVSAQVAQNPSYPYHAAFSQSQPPVHSQPVANIVSRRDEYQTGPSAQGFSSSYASHQGPSVPLYTTFAEQTPHLPYPSHSQHNAPPNVPRSQQAISSNIVHPHQMLSASPTHPHSMLPANAPAQYYPQSTGGVDMASNLPLDSEQSEQSSASNVKLLPRLIGETDIPGEGPSWIYEDGTTCRKIIDGEPVNAQWGVTKAGKPRKRLAIACTTCREKKIKCDPAEPRCLQCEKVGRECRFTTARIVHP
ncbi:hypothetical protein N7G274_006735 [Stereocaulon virgatum]|uniref:Zn(2)-C6 fungal-type domain-containing protein n=1 Tax=Stereocaulon virgatum TaxID=373712 RepID=A0ABR4A776_9LECA